MPRGNRSGTRLKITKPVRELMKRVIKYRYDTQIEFCNTHEINLDTFRHKINCVKNPIFLTEWNSWFNYLTGKNWIWNSKEEMRRKVMIDNHNLKELECLLKI